MIRVVSGVAVRAVPNDGTTRAHHVVLMGLRKPSKLRPNLWELPGGKIELGETAEHALKREWWEELGVNVTQVGDLIDAHVFDLEQSIAVELYPIMFDGEPVEADHAELRWVAPRFAVESMPCSPGFYVHYARLERWIASCAMLFAQGASR